MTQRQILHPPGELPICSCGLLVRHYHDLRKPEANGGHLLECAPCDRRTARHAQPRSAIEEWCRMVGVPLPKSLAQAEQPLRRLTGGRA